MSQKFENVTAEAVANVYFDGKVVSHSITFADGTRKTLGVIFPGAFNFDTAAKERMEITAGSCDVKLAGETAFRTIAAGAYFDVPANSAFDIHVASGVAQYVCSYG